MTCTCGKSWTGLKMAHCASCHETFSTVTTFDLHRVGYVDSRHCLVMPALRDSVGLWQNEYGTWFAEGERDVTEWLHRA